MKRSIILAALIGWPGSSFAAKKPPCDPPLEDDGGPNSTMALGEEGQWPDFPDAPGETPPRDPDRPVTTQALGEEGKGPGRPPGPGGYTTMAIIETGKPPIPPRK